LKKALFYRIGRQLVLAGRAAQPDAGWTFGSLNAAQPSAGLTSNLNSAICLFRRTGAVATQPNTGRTGTLSTATSLCRRSKGAVLPSQRQAVQAL